MSKTVNEKRVKAVPAWMGILVFLLAFVEEHLVASSFWLL